MKKKLLFCIHNHFFLKHYFLDLKRLENDYEITIITSNYLIKNQKLEEDYILQNMNIKNIFFIPFYRARLQRSLITIFATHLYLLRLKRKVDFKKFDICVTDNKFFLWQRVVIDKYLSKTCKKIGIATGSISLDLSIFKKLILGIDIKEYINRLHKLRKYNPAKRISEKDFSRKLTNIKNRFLDVFFDRIFLSFLFQFQNFSYKEKDLKILETDNFDYKVLFHYANFIFWQSIYENKNNVIFAKHTNNCNCMSSKKNKFLFLSSLIWESDESKILKQIKFIVNFFITKSKNLNDITEIHIKHHPEESDLNIEFINNLLRKNFPQNAKIIFINKSKSLGEIACDYSIVFGMMSTALVDVKNACKFVKVYCLKSLSVNEYGEDYFLKLFNEDIIFYDDFKNEIDKKLNIYQDNSKKYERIDFVDFLKMV